jgi:hypothetical protein
MFAVAWSDQAPAKKAVMSTAYRLMKRADCGYWLVQSRWDSLPEDCRFSLTRSIVAAMQVENFLPLLKLGNPKGRRGCGYYASPVGFETSFSTG